MVLYTQIMDLNIRVPVGIVKYAVLLVPTKLRDRRESQCCRKSPLFLPDALSAIVYAAERHLLPNGPK
jgi:hypothetical protein